MPTMKADGDRLATPATRPDLPQWLRLAGLVSLALIAMAGKSAMAQSWRLEPTVQGNVILTDNSRVGTNAPAAKELVIGLTPGLKIVGRGSQTRFDGDVSLRLVDYVKNTLSDSAFLRGRLALGADLIEHWLHVETSVSSDQSALDPFSLRQGDTISSEDLTTTRYRLSPYVERQLSSSLTFLARSDNLWTRRSGDAAAGLTRRNSQVQQNVVRLERRPIPFGASLELSSQRSKYPDDIDAALDLEALRAVVTYAPIPEVIVGVLSGRERSRFALNNSTDTIYGGSLAWRPGERSDLSVKAEHRFFGWGGTAEARHRSPFFVLSLRLDRAPIAQPSSLLLASGTGDVAALLDAAFTTRYPVPAERDVVVRNLIASRGLPSSLSGPLDVFPDYVQLREQATISASFLGRNTTVTISAYGGKSTQLLREEDPYVPSPATDSDNRQSGVTLDVNRRISAVSTISLQVAQTRIDGLGSRSGDTSKESMLTLGVTHSLSPRTSLAAGVRRRLFSSTVNASSRELAAYFGSNHRF